MPSMPFRFVVCIDVEGEDLRSAYRRLLDFFDGKVKLTATEGWETSDEAYDGEGEQISPDVLQKTIVDELADRDEEA